MQNALKTPRISYDYAGLFTKSGEWTHPDRTEKTHELIYVVSGKFTLWDSGRVRQLKAGDALLLLPGTRHYGTEESCGVSFYWVHFRVSKSACLPFEETFFENAGLGGLFRELLHTANLSPTPKEAVEAVLTHILSSLYLQSEFSRDEASRRVREIYEWLRINASPALRMREVSGHFGYSPAHITRLLKRKYGVGAKEIVTDFLLTKARELLCCSGMYVKEIAAQLGFPSDKAFIQFFTFYEGESPGAYRERFRRVHMNRE